MTARVVLALAATLFLFTCTPSAQSAASWRDPGLESFDVAWQTIDENYYDPSFGGVDWAAVRRELRPKAEQAASADDIRRVIQDMLTRLHQSHFVLLSSSEAIELERQRRPTVRPAGPGEVVTLGNLPGLVVRTDVRELHTLNMRRVGLIAFTVWLPQIDERVAAAVDRFRHAGGLILDLRGNPGGLAAMMSGIAGHVLADESVVLGRMQTRGGQLEFHPNPRTVTDDARIVKPFAGPVAILVDEGTGSTSECFAGALQALGRARVFGQRTMGEALPALTKRLANGDVLMYGIGNFVTSTGRSLEGAGVTPDETVPASPAGQDDAVIQAALAWIDRLSGNGKPLVH